MVSLTVSCEPEQWTCNPLTGFGSGDGTGSYEGGSSSRFPSSQVQIDPDLAAVIKAWPRLPEAVRAGGHHCNDQIMQ